MNNLSAESVLDRLQKALDVRSDSALSRALGVKRATLGNWRNRNSVPYSICVNIALQKGISLNWLLVEQGEMLFNRAGQSTETGCSDHTKLIDLFELLNIDQQKDVLQNMSEKKRLNDLESAVYELQKNNITPMHM